MSKQDYYKVLGVTKDATDADIKKAYRRAAQQHHPDRNDGDKMSEDKFKEAKEAYEVLSDTNKRRTYDHHGHQANVHQQRPGGVNPEDILRAAQQAWAREHATNTTTQHIGVPLDIMMNGGEISLPVMTVESTGAYGQVRLNRKIVSVKIDPNTPVGYRVEVDGDKNNIAILLAADIANFGTDGINIITQASVDIFDLMLGKEFTITHANGKQIKGSVPPGVSPGSTMRIAGKGLTDVNGSTGDLFVQINASSPTLNAKQKKILEEAIKKIKES